MKKQFLLLSLFFSGLFSSAMAEDLPKIAITQIVEHPALNEIYQGFIKELKEQGYEEGKNIDLIYKVAQGDMSINTQIAQQFSGLKPKLILAISTPSAQAAIAATHKKIPILFTGVSDPLKAGLVNNLEKPNEMVSGVMESQAIAENIDLILKLIPKVKKVGTVYNPSEDNSNSTNAELKKLLAEKNLELVEAAAKNTGDVLEAARSLVGKVEVILISQDNTAVSAFPAIAQVANQSKIPLITFDTFSVANGAAIGLGYEEMELGKVSAKQAIKILKGEEVGLLPVESPRILRLVINEKAAELQGLEIPEDLKEKANEIIK